MPYISAYIAAVVHNAASMTARRLREESGQTAAEYMGIIVVVAAIIGAILTSEVDTKIVDGIKSQIDKILGK